MFSKLFKVFKRKEEVKPIKREFKVGHTKDKDSDIITSYFVTDANNNAELDTRPQLMTFHVSVLYPADDQKQRAEEYVEYMNKIMDAMHQAYENNKLMDVLKGDDNG